jgi:hypothetical protein
MCCIQNQLSKIKRLKAAPARSVGSGFLLSFVVCFLYFSFSFLSRLARHVLVEGGHDSSLVGVAVGAPVLRVMKGLFVELLQARLGN